MSLALNEEQRLLKDTAEGFFRENAPISALRKLRDEEDATGFSRELWQQIIDMGWAGIFVPETYGGLGLGFVELGVVLEASGRTLVASPLFSNIVLGASAILAAGDERQKQALLPAMLAGEKLVALALQESSHHSPSTISTEAATQGDGFVLSGCKRYVLDGHTADTFIVAARTRGEVDDRDGISLFLVDSDARGVSVERRIMVDSRNMAEVRFDDVAVDASALMGTLNEASAVIERVVDRGNAALAAEMLGSALEAFERTLDYLKQREQFGALIGTFQALQHRASQMFCELEMSRSVVMEALRVVDEDPDFLPMASSRAKVQVSETLRLVSDEAIQMHGGIGMTDEEEIGFFLKRARVAQQTLGDENYHLGRYASLRGY